MPNLLPNWTQSLGDLGDFNTRAAGRLIWATLLLIIGVGFVFALLKPPRMPRPFSNKVAVAIIPTIIIGTLVVAKLISSLQRTIIWLGFLALVGYAFFLVATRKPRDPEEPATWAECFAGAVAVFALMALGYAIVPHEFLTYANSGLKLGDSTQFLFQSNQDILGFIPIHYPFALPFPALRDIGVTIIYVVVLSLNLVLWVRWQERDKVAAEAPDDSTPAKRSRFGRPLRRSTPPEPAAAPAEPVGAGAESGS